MEPSESGRGRPSDLPDDLVPDADRLAEELARGFAEWWRARHPDSEPPAADEHWEAYEASHRERMRALGEEIYRALIKNMRREVDRRLNEPGTVEDRRKRWEALWELIEILV